MDDAVSLIEEETNKTLWYDRDKPFSQSKIWDLQRKYYENHGMDAWHSGQVPHYISTNPTIAWQYARLVLAMMDDWQRSLQESGTEDSSEPLVVLELGTGHGRFTFHFLMALESLAGVPLESLPFRYIQSDLVESNIQFWLDHPQLLKWREKEILQASCLDMTQPFSLIEEFQSGEKIDLSIRKSPIVVIANYILDSLPMDLYYLQKGKIYEALFSLEWSNGERPSMEELYKTMHPRWSHKPLDESASSLAPWVTPLLKEYINFSGQYVSLPTIGLQFLNQLNQYHNFPCFILVGDKGPRGLFQAVSPNPSSITSHGSISLEVNFHSICCFVRHLGGIVLQPNHQSEHFTQVGLLLNGAQHSWNSLVHIYQHQNSHYGGDEFFILKKCMEKQIEHLGVHEICSWIRQSHYDANIFSLIADRLASLINCHTHHRNEDIAMLLDAIWERYYRLGSGNDIAGQIGMILYRLCFYEETLEYLHFSQGDYGENCTNAYLMMLCYVRLEQWEMAKQACAVVVSLDDKFMEIQHYRVRLQC